MGYHLVETRDLAESLESPESSRVETFNLELFKSETSDVTEGYILDDCIVHDLASKITREANEGSYRLEHGETWEDILNLVDQASVRDDITVYTPQDLDERIGSHYKNPSISHCGINTPSESYREVIGYLDEHTEEKDLERYVPGLDIAEADIGLRDQKFAMAALNEMAVVTYDDDFLGFEGVDVTTPLGALYNLS